MENLNKTEKAMDLLSILKDPRFREKTAIAEKLEMSTRQVYRAWRRVVANRKESLLYVDDLKKWKSYCLFLHTFFTEKWYPDPEKEFTKKDTTLLGKIEKDLRKLVSSKAL